MRDPPTDTLLHHGAWLHVGLFDCPRSHPRFTDSGPTQGDLIVFPRHAVTIHQEGHACVVADATVVTLYNRGQHYRRGAIAAYGDTSVYYVFSPQVLREALVERGRDHAGLDRGPFDRAHAPAPAAAFLLERTLARRLRLGSPPAMQIEEGALRLLDLLLDALPQRPRIRVRRAGVEARQRRCIRECQALLAADPEAPHALASLGRALGVSEFHLCRLFRTFTGRSVHRHLTELRLRAAADRLLDGARGELSHLALELGFSSHAHFSAAFARFAGVPPSRWGS